MRSFSKLALLALPLFGSVFADEPASPSTELNSIYSSAHEAFQDLLNALPEESLQAALRGLKDFKDGVFETHHRGVEQVHNHNPALATKLIVAAVQDLKKRQTPSNGTSTAPPQQSPQSVPESSAPPTQDTSSPAAQPSSPAASPPATTTATPTTTADRPIIVTVQQTTTNTRGETIVQTTSVLSQVTASIAVTTTLVNAAGSTVTRTTVAPAVIRTTTDTAGRAATITSVAQFAPTAGEVRTETDPGGKTFVTTYTPGGGKISSVKLITTTGADGRPSTITSYEYVDPAQTVAPPGGGNGGSQTTGRPGLQTGAAVKNAHALGYAGAVGALAFFM